MKKSRSLVPKVAIIGTRGYPSYYGGFETAIRKLAPYLADHGWDVSVYGRPGATRRDDPSMDPRVTKIETRGIESKSLSTLSYGLTATRDAVRRKTDVALIMNVANGYWLPQLRRAGIPTLLNVDGIEWDREKWNRAAKFAFRRGAQLTARHATQLVFDSEAIGRRWRTDFKRDGIFIPYGGDFSIDSPAPLGLERRKYVLLVARFVPENTISAFMDAMGRMPKEIPVVLVGSSGYGGELDDRARLLADEYDHVRWLGHVNDDELLRALWQNAGAYFHGHSVGGTNPALVQAMAYGAPVIARDTEYNREVLNDNTQLCLPTPEDIALKITALVGDATRQEAVSNKNKSRARKFYAWPSICESYNRALQGLLC